jgi:hypothetical protein
MFWINTTQNSFEITSGQRWLRKKAFYKQAFMLHRKESVLLEGDQVIGRTWRRDDRWHGSFKTADGCMFPLLPVNDIEESKRLVEQGYKQDCSFRLAFELFYK